VGSLTIGENATVTGYIRSDSAFTISTTTIIDENKNFIHSIDTVSDGDTTPDVTGFTWLVYNGTTTNDTITNLDNAVIGVEYTLIGNAGSYIMVIEDSGNFNLNTSSGTWDGDNDNTLTVICTATDTFIEKCRSVNINP